MAEIGKYDVQGLIDAWASGTTHHHITSVFAQSKNFVVFRVEGHKYWSGLGQPFAYAPVTYVLVPKGIDGWRAPRREWEGRLTKAKEREIREVLQASEDAGYVCGWRVEAK
jgi:hypothetical protein